MTCQLLRHRNQDRIFISFENTPTLNAWLNSIPNAKWSKTYKSWHIPDTPENRYKCGLMAANEEQPGEMNVEMDRRNSLQTVLEKKETRNPGPVAGVISPGNKHQMQQFIQQLHLKAYSPSTIRTYRNEFGIFLQTLSKVPAENLSVQRIKDYLFYCHERLKLRENTIHSRMNALKFYYEQVLGKEKFFFEIPRPKRPLLLPNVLNEKELARMFNALCNKKHKAILFTAYSAGLRVSEVVNLKLADIDSRRMQMHIRHAKGKKDRYVNLSPVLLDILRQYLILHKPRPKEYLFESSQTGGPYPTRTLQQIFSNAKNRAGIRKDVGIHSLRHSFATHLLDKGTDIKYIKEILGHFDIKTTERYLHVSKKQLVNLISPFDDLWRTENIDW